MLKLGYSAHDIQRTRDACAQHFSQVPTHISYRRREINVKLRKPHEPSEKLSIDSALEEISGENGRTVMQNEGWKSPAAKTKQALEKLAGPRRPEIAAFTGCENPSPILVGSRSTPGDKPPIWDVLKASDWSSQPIDADLQWNACRHCPTCARSHTMKVGDLACLEFWNKPVANIITLTFLSQGMQLDLGYSLWAVGHFRKVLARKASRKGFTWRQTVAHELGSIQRTFRRHFHLTAYHSTEVVVAMLADLMDTDPILEHDGGIRFWPQRAWPFGTVHVKPVTDIELARYGAKYSAKSLLLAGCDSHAEQRHLLAARGEPLLNTYFNYPRAPAIGLEGLRTLVTAQKERLMDERLRRPEQILGPEDGPTGLVCPAWDDRPRRTLSLRRDDKARAAAILSDLVGEELSWSQIFRAKDTYRNQIVEEALHVNATEWVLE